MDYLLAILLVGTNAYWAFINQKLINKLMSRNYHEYQVASTIQENKSVKVEEPENFHPEDLGNLTF